MFSLLISCDQSVVLPSRPALVMMGLCLVSVVWESGMVLYAPRRWMVERVEMSRARARAVERLDLGVGR